MVVAIANKIMKAIEMKGQNVQNTAKGRPFGSHSSMKEGTHVFSMRPLRYTALGLESMVQNGTLYPAGPREARAVNLEI